MLIGVVSVLSLARSIGISLSFLQMGWINSVVLFTTQLPFTVAGGLGIREVTLVTLLPTLGVSSDLALALSFLIFIRSVLLALLGGLLEAVRAFRSDKSSNNTISIEGTSVQSETDEL